MLAPVSPAPFVRTVIGPMTRVLNPLIVKFAGRRHFFMAAQIQHVGRRSGKVYVTPATAHLVRAYLAFPPAWVFLGKQTLYLGEKPKPA
jgi:hypothetical protein